MNYLVDPELKTPPREGPAGIKRRYLEEVKELLECLDVPVDVATDEYADSEIQDKLRFRTSGSIRYGDLLPGSVGARKRQRSQSMGYDTADDQRHGNGRSIEEPSRNP